MDWLDELEGLFTKATEAVCEKETAVVFSSGVDSALVAYAAAKRSKVTAYHVGVEGCEDTKFAKRVQEDAPFKVKILTLSMDDIESLIPKILGIWPHPDPIDVGVAIPFHIAAKAASEDGHKALLCGQGGDELFGGYWRYLDCMVEKGPDAVAALMEKDWENAYEDNLDRDTAMCRAWGCELRFPYLDKPFSDYSRKMPLELKIREGGDLSCDEIAGRRFVRKYALKRLAIRMGVPEFVADRVKKAAQYGSGTNKALDKIARREGYKEKSQQAGRTDYLRMFLEERLRTI
jgi:asparagine synthase (glutamine-hydrolysing)